ncbi:hypothetical protein [Pseudoroseomonas cervicalis]|uniref:hypothetical protein n=1 Tax=Teichococcus cervicalis TaxID=204525 RepID=UPI0022F1D207|nr:hypothetical protein [Pseudoroseomonas cervicalis]WBV42437.1 hypothetical protein PFY06_14490 [Pseudoroseomonas cervicalis]
MRPSACLLALCALAPLALAGPARAQLRSLTVPAESGIVVLPRGQAPPRLVAPPVPPRSATVALAEPREAPAPVQLPAGGTGLAGPLGAVLPMAAAALLGGSLASGGSSGGGGATTATTGLAPARTSR